MRKCTHEENLREGERALAKWRAMPRRNIPITYDGTWLVRASVKDAEGKVWEGSGPTKRAAYDALREQIRATALPKTQGREVRRRGSAARRVLLAMDGPPKRDD